MERYASDFIRKASGLGLAVALCVLLAGTSEATARVDTPSNLAPASSDSEASDDAAATAVFERTDSNHDGQLSLEEFKAGVSASRLGVIYQRLPSKFRSADINQSGFLETQEFAALPIIKSAGSQAPTLASADGDHDARIDFREYVAMMAQLDGATP